MPFAMIEKERIGSTYLVEPVEGFGWHEIRDGKMDRQIELPPAFQAVLDSVIANHDVELIESIEHLTDTECILAMIGRIDLAILGLNLAWISFIARTDNIMDVMKHPVGCFLLLASEKPVLSGTPFGDPRFLESPGACHIRGYAQLSWPAPPILR